MLSVLAILLTGCGGAEPAAAPIGLGALERSASLLRLAPADWGTTSARALATTTPATDVLEIGGPDAATAHFAFELPAAHVVHAELVLPAHPSWSGPARPADLILHRTLPFRSEGLTRRHSPPALGAPVALLEVAVGAPRTIRVELTEAVRYVVRLRDRRLFLALRVRNAPSSWRLGSPQAIDPAQRPRLDVLRR